MKAIVINLFILLIIIISCKKDPPIDKTPPNTVITYPANGAVITKEINITIDAVDNIGIKKVECYIDGVLFATDSISPYSYSWNVNYLNSDTHTIYAKSYDLSGNIGQSALVTVSLKLPDVAVPVLISPINSEYADTSVVNFKWSSIRDGISYNVQISTDSTFSTNLESLTVADTFLTKNFSTNAVRYWRLQAKSKYEKLSEWSSKKSFAIPLQLPMDEKGITAVGIKKSNDGGFVVLYSSLSKIGILKLTSNVNKVFERVFPDLYFSPAYSFYHENQFSVDYVGNIIISGRYRDGTNALRYFVMKCDKMGNNIWSKYYSSPGESIYASSVLQSGDIITGGGINLSTEGRSYGRILNLDSNGELIRSFNTANSGRIRSVLQTTDGNCVYIAEDTINKYSSNGSLLWAIPIPIDADGGEKTADGGFLLFAGNEHALSKINLNGIVESSFTVTRFNPTRIMSIEVTKDNGYLINGTTEISSSISDHWVIKTNSNYSEIWSKYFKHSDKIGFYSVTEDANGDYIFLSRNNLFKYSKEGKIINF